MFLVWQYMEIISIGQIVAIADSPWLVQTRYMADIHKVCWWISEDFMDWSLLTSQLIQVGICVYMYMYLYLIWASWSLSLDKALYHRYRLLSTGLWAHTIIHNLLSALTRGIESPMYLTLSFLRPMHAECTLNLDHLDHFTRWIESMNNVH